jgi:hypothetical protein
MQQPSEQTVSGYQGQLPASGDLRLRRLNSSASFLSFSAFFDLNGGPGSFLGLDAETKFVVRVVPVEVFRSQLILWRSLDAIP